MIKREELINKYDGLFEKYGLKRPVDSKKVAMIVKSILVSFLADKNNPALYGYGNHTKELLADFVSELRNVRCIIDNYAVDKGETGYRVIRKEEILANNVDGVIISSYIYRKEIREELQKESLSIPILDIYEELNRRGVEVRTEYYKNVHPHHYYKVINELNRKPKSEYVLLDLVTQYLHIKDFRMAIQVASRLVDLRENHRYTELKEDIGFLYAKEKEAIEEVSKDNILLLCLDGFRGEDLNSRDTPLIYQQVKEKGYSFTNTYSYSTSTFESLLPIYSENYDSKKTNHHNNAIDESECPFIKTAIMQNRKICFYTDMDSYIISNHISYVGEFQTITQKIWSYILDSLECTKGLFLIHESYETHYSFSNPYTQDELISEGTTMMFDFLPLKGGALRTDYEKQHMDSVRYIDDTIGEFLKLSNNKIVLYSDHGNMILPLKTRLKDIKEMHLICSDEWTKVPLVVFDGDVGECDELNSLSCLNGICEDLLNGKSHTTYYNEYIKMARTEIYNPDYIMLYKEMGYETDLMAYECFRFRDGVKIVVFSNGIVRFFKNDYEIQYENEDYRVRIDKIREKVTVCDRSLIQ